MDAKTKRTIADWKALLKKQELREIINWWDSIIVDERFFTSSNILFDMPEHFKDQVIQVYVDAGMPRFFFEGLKKVSIYRDSWKNSAGDDCLGFYSDANATIFLSPSEFSSPGGLKSTAIHELGHHLDVMLGYRLDVDLPEKLKELNRKHPGRFKNIRELFATIFRATFEEGDFQKTFWEGYTGVPNLHASMFKKKRK